MPKFKVIYDAPFSNVEKIIDADDLKDAEEIAELSSIYKNFTVEELFDAQD